MYLLEKTSGYKLKVTLDKFYPKRVRKESTGEIFCGYLYFEEVYDEVLDVYTIFLRIYDENKEKQFLVVPVRISGKPISGRSVSMAVPRKRGVSGFPYTLCMTRKSKIGLIYMTDYSTGDTKLSEVYRVMLDIKG